MRVDHVVIVAFLKKGDVETEDGAEALLSKYQARTDARPKSCHLIHVKDDASWGTSLQTGAFRKGEHFEHVCETPEIGDAVATSDNVGVYLILHGTFSGGPMVFRAQKNFRAADASKTAQTGLLVVRLLKCMGLRKVRKLCLLMCNGAIAENSFVEHICSGLKSEMDQPPIVAGWDSFISLKVGGDHRGRKVKNRQDAPSDSAFKNEHKMVYVYSGENYERKTLIASGWSDKEHLATKNPIGAVTL